MTLYTIATGSNGQQIIVSNSVANSAGTLFDVDAYVDDSDQNPFLIFTASVFVTPSLEFITTSNRVFYATGVLSEQ
jgi:hypothetical protein